MRANFQQVSRTENDDVEAMSPLMKNVGVKMAMISDCRTLAY